MSTHDAYIVAARRSALGRVGGLHGRRRIEDLAGPILRAALGDSKINPAIIDGIVLGNATEASNPARPIPAEAPEMAMTRDMPRG